MAKRKGRSMSSYMRGTVDEGQSLGTLAPKTLIGQNFDEAPNEITLVSSIVSTYTLDQWTPLANAGPILVGIAHSDYTDAEIEAWLENAESWEVGDLPQQEVARRLIRKVGVFDTPDDAIEARSLNDGKPIKTKLNWTLHGGDTLKQWSYNMGAAAVSGTSNPNVRMEGHVNLWTL